MMSEPRIKHLHHFALFLPFSYIAADNRVQRWRFLISCEVQGVCLAG